MTNEKVKISYNRFLFGMILILIAAFAFKQIPPKTYTVSKSKEDWLTALRYIENGKRIMLRSSYSGTEIAAWSDSLSILEQDISTQVSLQLMTAEKEEQKKDSIKPKIK